MKCHAALKRFGCQSQDPMLCSGMVLDCFGRFASCPGQEQFLKWDDRILRTTMVKSKRLSSEGVYALPA